MEQIQRFSDRWRETDRIALDISVLIFEVLCGSQRKNFCSRQQKNMVFVMVESINEQEEIVLGNDRSNAMIDSKKDQSKQTIHVPQMQAIAIIQAISDVFLISQKESQRSRQQKNMVCVMVEIFNELEGNIQKIINKTKN